MSHRAQEDARQIDLIRQAWADSGKVYGYRKLPDDLRDQGERISENRVARLASLNGIAAQVGYKCRPVRYGGTPAIVAENKLEQQFQASAPDQVWVAAERGLRDRAFEIVFRAEHALGTCLALPFGERPELIEPPGDHGGEALLAMYIRGADPEKWGRHLCGPMCSPEPLDRGVSAPAGLEQIVPPPLLVLRRLGRMVGASRPTGIGEDKDVFFAIHECGGLG